MAGKATGTKRKTTGGAGKKATGSRSRTGSTRKTTAKTTNRKTNTAASTKRQSTKRKTGGRTRSIEEMNEYQDHLAFEQGMTLFVLCVLALLCYISLFGLAGKIGTCVGGVLIGVFGWIAWLVPIAVVCGFIFVMVNSNDRRVIRKVISVIGILLVGMALTDLLTGNKTVTDYYQISTGAKQGMGQRLFQAFSLVLHNQGNGGIIGRAIAHAGESLLGKIGAGLLLFALLLLAVYGFYGLEWMAMLRKRNAYHREMGEAYEILQEEENYEKPSYQVRLPRERRRIHSNRMMQSVDLQAMNEQINRMEENRAKQETEEKPQRQTVGAMEEILPKVEHARKPMDRILSEKKAESVRHTQAAEEKKPEQKQPLEDIPIYREELEHKFGGKAQSAELESAIAHMSTTTLQVDSECEQIDAEAVPLSRMAAPGSLSEIAASETELLSEITASEAGALSEITTPEVSPLAETVESQTEMKPLSETIVSELQAEESSEVSAKEVDELLQEWNLSEQANTSEEQDVALEEVEEQSNKPLQSFVYKEEVTDVIPSVQKATRSRQKHSSVTSGQAERKRAGVASFTPKTKNDSTKAAVKAPAPSVAKESVAKKKEPYQFPPIDIMKIPEHIPGRINDITLRKTAMHLQETLKSFHVNVTMGAVTCGPTVTRYEVLPEQGVRVNKITNLADDLKLSLAAPSIRIEAPIPGKAAVGIEVPNPESSPVYFRELLEGEEFQKAKSPVTFAVGKDIAGKRIMADISKMPHLLIAGATGSGKSVCINTLIMSILYKADPDEVKLIMIDPKVVELSVYNGIPHLFCPVVTDPKEAAAALNWAVREMMDRYKKFEELGVRGIAGYNEKIQKIENAAEAGYEKMPLLVIIVDEFADLMMVASKEVEDAVCRLAQLARAAGIHLVLATQRPSVNVITGLIKANIPSRIAFSVSSAIDSRTILDRGGAEKLIGKGDMLFFASGQSDPIRVQGAFISDREVGEVVDFLQTTNEEPEYNHKVTEVQEPVEENKPDNVTTKSDNDEYFEDAGRFVIESERAAAGQLQRRFSIGFNRAGRIIDQLHKAGVVGAAEGTKPRKVLMTMEQFEAYLRGEERQTTEAETLPDDLLEMMTREVLPEEDTTMETIDSLE